MPISVNQSVNYNRSDSKESVLLTHSVNQSVSYSRSDSKESVLYLILSISLSVTAGQVARNLYCNHSVNLSVSYSRSDSTESAFQLNVDRLRIHL